MHSRCLLSVPIEDCSHVRVARCELEFNTGLRALRLPRASGAHAVFPLFAPTRSWRLLKASDRDLEWYTHRVIYCGQQSRLLLEPPDRWLLVPRSANFQAGNLSRESSLGALKLLTSEFLNLLLCRALFDYTKPIISDQKFIHEYRFPIYQFFIVQNNQQDVSETQA